MAEEKKFSWKDLLDENREGKGYHFIPEAMSDIYIVIYAMLSIAGFLEKDISQKERKELLEQHKRMCEYVKNRYQHTAQDFYLPLEVLTERLELSKWQVFCILIASLSMHSPQSGGIFNIWKENMQRPCPNKKIACSVYQKFEEFPIEEYQSLVSENVFFELFFDMEKEGLQKEFSLRESAFSFLMGGQSLTSECREFCTCREEWWEREDIIIYKREAGELKHIVKRIFEKKNFNKKTENTVICLTGEEGSGKKLLVFDIAASFGKSVIYADFHLLEKRENMKEAISLLALEGILKDSILCITNYTKKHEYGEELLRDIVRLNSVFFLTAENSVLKEISCLARCAEVNLKKPDVGEKIELWEYFLKNYNAAQDVTSEYLGSRYVVNAGSIKSILKTAALYGEGENSISMEAVKTAVKQYQAARLSAFAEPIPICYAWEDLVVEEEVEKQLRHICSRISYKNIVETTWGFGKKLPYGKGACALFYGPPGTGKTMAVQVLAKEMGLELYRIDLSKMISKYIGETQKHISELFEKAKEMNALLFFDEADAFFSKRTEVSDALDRHANGDVAQLLQKLEEYEGISVLATNLKDNIDNAFKRRIQYMVHFQQPDAANRKLLWEKQFPPEVPVEEELEIEFFAEHFELSGSEIKNVVLTAAYMAAEKQQPISNRYIMEALKLNYAKYGRILTRADFGDMLW